jgi:hypothetical protein
MLNQFYEDLKNLPKAKFNAKYTAPCLIFCLGIILLGQLIMIVEPLSQLNKASGRITDLTTRVLFYKTAKFSSQSTPTYGLVITLDNSHSYDIQDQSTMIRLEATLKLGDDIVIYYPTRAITIISAGLVEDVSQVERGSQTLYSWQEQKNEEWIIVGFLILAMGLFYGLMRHFRN